MASKRARFKERVQQRQEEAKQRQAARDARTWDQQLDVTIKRGKIMNVEREGRRYRIAKANGAA